MQNLQESNVYLRGIFTKRWRHLLLEIEAKGRVANFVWYNVSYGLGEVVEVKSILSISMAILAHSKLHKPLKSDF
jgi:hypothetical protein